MLAQDLEKYASRDAVREWQKLLVSSIKHFWKFQKIVADRIMKSIDNS